MAHLGALAPLALLLWDYFAGNLSVNPIQDITYRTGKPALALLVLSLACTPANTLFKFRPALRMRRALGLYAFLYVVLHFFTFIGLDYGFDAGLLREAIFEKRYALVGFSAFLLLLPLAVTSTRGWQRRLGRRWRALHKLAYVAPPLAVIRYVWLVKSDLRQPVAFGVVVALLLAARLPPVRRFASRLNGWGWIKAHHRDSLSRCRL
ncbi:MAG: sulfoxide reductase heme-binding subunit YedZ [Chloroflexi bacterium]|nr:sulfoxide reductase heme-binding subunit YedZ [Chloroflexota bacterium]